MDREDQVNEALKELLCSDYGEAAAEKIWEGYVPRPVTLRVNTLKLSAEEGKSALLEAGFSFESVPWYASALILRGTREEELRRTPLYEEGKIYLQSLSSMLPPLCLAPKTGESILDMTAAPGGKTTELAALSEGKALITACERDRTRFERLKFNLARQGAGRVTALCADALTLDEHFSFDKILLDAPCSGSGTADGRPLRIDSAYVERCARLQENLLKKALRLLKKGGTMLYSTCSVLKREDEQVLKNVLPPNVRIEPIEGFEGIPRLPSMEGTVCVAPTQLYEGFFLAKLKKE